MTYEAKNLKVVDAWILQDNDNENRPQPEPQIDFDPNDPQAPDSLFSQPGKDVNLRFKMVGPPAGIFVHFRYTQFGEGDIGLPPCATYTTNIEYAVPVEGVTLSSYINDIEVDLRIHKNCTDMIPCAWEGIGHTELYTVCEVKEFDHTNPSLGDYIAHNDPKILSEFEIIPDMPQDRVTKTLMTVSAEGEEGFDILRCVDDGVHETPAVAAGLDAGDECTVRAYIGIANSAADEHYNSEKDVTLIQLYHRIAWQEEDAALVKHQPEEMEFDVEPWDLEGESTFSGTGSLSKVEVREVGQPVQLPITRDVQGFTDSDWEIEGMSRSGSLGDIQFEWTFPIENTPFECTAETELTVIEIDLSISSMLPAEEDNPGLALAVDPEYRHIISMFISPAVDFGTATVDVDDGSRVRAYVLPTDTTPVSFPYEKVPKSMPIAFWYEGVQVSNSVRDVVVSLSYESGGVSGGDQVSITVLGMEITHPSGDPTAPYSAGPTNEFVYGTTNPKGTFSISCTADLLPDAADSDFADLLRWEISEIGDSHTTPDSGDVEMEWSVQWPSAPTMGRGTASTVQFTGLPPENEDFGQKTVTLNLIAPYERVAHSEVALTEVFFDRDATNHPGAGAGTTPNWFFYWLQVASDPQVHANSRVTTAFTTVYGGAGVGGLDGEVPAMMHWSYDAPQIKTQLKLYDHILVDQDRIGALPSARGILMFCLVYLHESMHIQQIARGDAEVGIVQSTCWRYGWSWNTPRHNHWDPKGTVGAPDYDPTGAPGAKGVDDDNDLSVDNQVLTTPNAPGELGVTQDLDLEPVAYRGQDWHTNWPFWWTNNPYPFFFIDGDLIEEEAYQNEDHEKNLWVTHYDWGSPGFMHGSVDYGD